MSKQSLNPLQTRMLPPRSRMRLTPSSPMGSSRMALLRLSSPMGSSRMALLRLSSPTDSSRMALPRGSRSTALPRGSPVSRGRPLASSLVPPLRSSVPPRTARSISSRTLSLLRLAR